MADRSLGMINFEIHPLLIHEPDRILMACSFERRGVKGGERPEGYVTALVQRAGGKGKCSGALCERRERQNWSCRKTN